MKVSKESIPGMNVFFNHSGYEQLDQFLAANSFSKIFILVDSNTHQHCLPGFLARISNTAETEVVEMQAGEDNKDLETCNGIWKVLSELGCDRKSLVINLGGGVVTDLGGFIAATFKRGIPFINVPTTLLAMVDAAVGGKSGVNLDGLKNQIGVIQPAELILVDTSFLETLSAAEMRSGLAEMLKHGLIQDEAYWKKMIALKEMTLADLDELILDSIRIKGAIVEQDPREENLRKSLNYGHTLGHAIESYFLAHPSREKILHGEAVAVGMILATYLSSRLLEFPSGKLREISQGIHSVYGKISFDKEDQDRIIELLKFDKKNEGGKINFVLLEDIGKPVMDCHVPHSMLYEAFSYYLEIQ